MAGGASYCPAQCWGRSLRLAFVSTYERSCKIQADAGHAFGNPRAMCVRRRFVHLLCPAAAPMRVRFVIRGGPVVCTVSGIAWTALVSYPRLHFAAARLAGSLWESRLMWHSGFQIAAHRFSFSQDELLQITKPKRPGRHAQFYVSIPPWSAARWAVLLSQRQARVAAYPLLPSKACEQRGKWQHWRSQVEHTRARTAGG